MNSKVYRVFTPNNNGFRLIDLEKLYPYFKLRGDSPREALRYPELKQDVAEYGILTPLIVRPIRFQDYEVLDGLKRYHIAKELNIERIPCVVKENISDDAAIFFAEHCSKSVMGITTTMGVLEDLDDLIGGILLAIQSIQGHNVQDWNRLNTSRNSLEELGSVIFKHIGPSKSNTTEVIIQETLEIINKIVASLQATNAQLFEVSKQDYATLENLKLTVCSTMDSLNRLEL